MKKTIKTFQYLPLLLLIVFSSCLKQQIGDYNPNAINELEIDSSIKDAYLLNVGDPFQLKANVMQSKPASNSRLVYNWYYYPAISNSEAEPIKVGNAAELDLSVDMNTGEYFLVLEVTDEATGVKAFKKIKLTVKKLSSEGWLLLTWQNNQANLSIVSSQNEVYQNFLTNEFPAGKQPEKLYCVNDWDPTAQTIVIQTNEPELYFLGYNDFDILGTSAQTFAQDPGIGFTYFGTDMYFQAYYLIDTDGALYTVSRGADPNFPEGFSQPLTGSYKLAPFIMPTVTSYPVPVVVYDEAGKRFLYQPYGESTLKSFDAAPPNAPFDLNNFTDKILATTLGANDITYVVAKNTENKIKVYGMPLNDALNEYPAESVATIDVPGGIVPQFFTFSGKLPILYFIAGQDLYVYKISENKVSHLYTFPGDEKVAALQMFRETINMTEATNPAVNNRLAIATNNTSGGVFYTFDLSPTGVLKTGQYSTRNDGFSNIADIAYKEQR